MKYDWNKYGAVWYDLQYKSQMIWQKTENYWKNNDIGKTNTKYGEGQMITSYINATKQWDESNVTAPGDTNLSKKRLGEGHE